MVSQNSRATATDGWTRYPIHPIITGFFCTWAAHVGLGLARETNFCCFYPPNFLQHTSSPSPSIPAHLWLIHCLPMMAPSAYLASLVPQGSTPYSPSGPPISCTVIMRTNRFGINAGVQADCKRLEGASKCAGWTPREFAVCHWLTSPKLWVNQDR
jgi:hypothetical protein